MDQASLSNIAALVAGVVESGREADIAISPDLDAVVVFAGSELVLSCDLATFSLHPALSAGHNEKVD
jgi:hypothetical protein